MRYDTTHTHVQVTLQKARQASSLQMQCVCVYRALGPT